MPGKLRRYFIEMNMVGGRGGTRTRGPLLAKQGEIQAKSLLRLRLRVLSHPWVAPELIQNRHRQVASGRPRGFHIIPCRSGNPIELRHHDWWPPRHAVMIRVAAFRIANRKRDNVRSRSHGDEL